MELQNLSIFNYDGDVIIEKSQVEGLSDGDIYIVSNCNGQLVGEISQSRDNFFTLMRNSPLFNSYNIKSIHDFSIFSKSGNLLDAVNNYANVIIPLTTPNVHYKQYLACRVTPGNGDMFISSMVPKAEELTKTSIEEALMNLAKYDPNACNRILDNLFTGDDVPTENESTHNGSGGLFGFFRDPISRFFAPGLVCACLSSIGEGVVEDSAFIDYQIEREIFKRFVSNCEVLRKAERKTKFSDSFINTLDNAKYEINYVFNSIWGANKNMAGLRKIIINQSDKKLIESYDNFLNKDKMAQDSKIKMLIEKSEDGIDKINKNDGIYRVYAFDGENKHQVHFARKPSCIIYMMYLMDKHKRGEDVDFLSISNNKELFCDLFYKVYHTNGEMVYAGLEAKLIKGDPRQTRLADCLLDIQNSLRGVIDDIGENLPPFIIPSKDSHITVRSDKITIPEELRCLAEKLKKS